MLKKLLTIVFLLTATAASAEIYKWKEGGKSQYGDTPPKGQSYTKVGAETSMPKAIEISKVKPETPADEAKAKDKAEEFHLNALSKSKADEANKKLSEMNCVSAKESLALYKAGGRIAVPGSSEHALMSDAEIATAEANARKDVSLWCN